MFAKQLISIAFLSFILVGCDGSDSVSSGHGSISASRVALDAAVAPQTQNQKPVTFLATLTGDKNSGLALQAGQFEIDTLMTSGAYESAGATLSQFGYKICTGFAEQSSVKLKSITTPPKVHFEDQSYSGQFVYTGSASYEMKLVKRGGYSSATICEVRYRITTDSSANTLTGGTFKVSEILMSETAVARDLDTNVIYNDFNHSTQKELVFTIHDIAAN
jgi:hypothetical protein